MPVELPANARELLNNIARSSLEHSFMQVFNEKPPDYILNNPAQIQRAATEWKRNYAHEIRVLAMVAEQSLNYCSQGHDAVSAGFGSRILTLPELSFIWTNPYFNELVSNALQDEDVNTLLTLLRLLTELPNV